MLQRRIDQDLSSLPGWKLKEVKCKVTPDDPQEKI